MGRIMELAVLPAKFWRPSTGALQNSLLTTQAKQRFSCSLYKANSVWLISPLSARYHT